VSNGNPLEVAFKRLTRATVALYLVLAVLGAYAYINASHQRNEVARVALETNNALCTLRGDLAQRIASARRFLGNNPEGIPGLPAKSIRESIQNQERTIDALSNLDCGG
jgi:hypothetical protein